ncbi:hypothetical protein RB195_010702 [Necator americanus]|uniref:Uncharacterized protein n=1 Tax=Necator americanus TaxID=51031 RepID=A0ABR1CZ45_NECAM
MISVNPLEKARSACPSQSERNSALDDLDRCDIATLLHHLLPHLDSLEKAFQTLLERTAPNSSCVFCTVDENRDNHYAGTGPRLPDSDSKTAQATKLNLCLLLLNTAHDDKTAAAHEAAIQEVTTSSTPIVIVINKRSATHHPSSTHLHLAGLSSHNKHYREATIKSRQRTTYATPQTP